MSRLRSVLVTAALATTIVALPAGAVHAQNCGAYSDEMAGPGGTYVAGPDCAAEGESVSGVGIDGMPDEPTVAGRDNPDAPPIYQDTATDEGERER
ncbi:MAG TPA: hypothetical protein VII06_24525 [Chloroflexota bacterium]|jgi:hypothetical protein